MSIPSKLGHLAMPIIFLAKRKNQMVLASFEHGISRPNDAGDVAIKLLLNDAHFSYPIISHYTEHFVSTSLYFILQTPFFGPVIFSPSIFGEKVHECKLDRRIWFMVHPSLPALWQFVPRGHAKTTICLWIKISIFHNFE